MSKAHAFAGRSPRLSKTAKSKKKTIVQRIAGRLATWLVDREDRLREVKLNREAARLNRDLSWQQEVMDRAARMRDK